MQPPKNFYLQCYYTVYLGSGQEVENRMIFASSVHRRTVGSRPEVENRMIFASSAYPRTVGSEPEVENE